MNAKHRAKLEKEKQLQRALGAVEYARQRAEAQINERAARYAESIVEKHTDMAIKEAVNVMQYIMAITLNTKFGFGTKRINELFREMRKQMECVTGGYVSGTDIINWCNEKGIEL